MFAILLFIIICGVPLSNIENQQVMGKPLCLKNSFNV